MMIPASKLQPVPWRNGRGISRDIATGRGPDGAVRWQVSIADLVEDTPFSHYPDCDRIFTPIAGDPPPELAFHGGPFTPCPLLVPKSFSGEWPTLSHIPAPGRAFNAVVDRRHHAATVTVHRLEVGETVTLPDAPAVILHCLSGLIACGYERLGPGDSMTEAASAPASALEAALAIVVSVTSRPTIVATDVT